MQLDQPRPELEQGLGWRRQSHCRLEVELGLSLPGVFGPKLRKRRVCLASHSSAGMTVLPSCSATLPSRVLMTVCISSGRCRKRTDDTGWPFLTAVMSFWMATMVAMRRGFVTGGPVCQTALGIDFSPRARLEMCLGGGSIPGHYCSPRSLLQHASYHTQPSRQR